jgi:hypothetical protein
MRKIELLIPEANERWDSRFIWEPDYEITVQVDGKYAIIKGNSAGLISLAKFLIILAQDEAVPGDHRHFDAGGLGELGELDELSKSLIISRT